MHYVKYLVIVTLGLVSLLFACQSTKQPTTLSSIQSTNDAPLAPAENNLYASLQQNTLKIQKKLIALMNRANEPFSNYKEKFYTLSHELNLHYQATKKLDNTELIIFQWDIFFTNSKEVLMFTRYFQEWEHKGTLSNKSIKIGVGNVKFVLVNIVALEQQLIDEETKAGK